MHTFVVFKFHYNKFIVPISFVCSAILMAEVVTCLVGFLSDWPAFLLTNSWQRQIVGENHSWMSDKVNAV